MTDQCFLEDLLDKGLSKLSFSVSSYQKKQLIEYLSLVEKWNKKCNLTAVRNPRDMVIKHLLDALSILPHLEQADTIDLGSGMGIPGVVLAIVWPESQVYLVDSNIKKVRFLRQVKLELSLENVVVLHQRVEDIVKVDSVGNIICRALASLDVLLAWSKHLMDRKVRFYAMKGKYPGCEIEVIPDGYQVVSTIAIEVPFLEDNSRHLVQVVKE